MSHSYPCTGHTTVEVTITEDHHAVVRASGELDIATADRLDDALSAAAQCCPVIHLDLADVRFMDARTAAVLDQHDRSCRRDGGRLHVHNSSGEPRKVLQLCGLDRLLA